MNNSDALRLPINRANVGRVDVCKTMLTKHPPTVYLAELGLCQSNTMPV
ncbi:hypothetical protein [Spirosoma agri]|uniref:Uncharacterized protein n=1 Tax=Spirosoma agri TaxID=1987381 RepID=A0A6M0IDQ2_9BACT|nr:hypothetical protein [Spirosoma agri]NEU65471.1 hypothetical protein [Spirosoma agri]